MPRLRDDAPAILRVLSELADPAKSDDLQRFLENPQEFLAGTEGLTDEERAIIVSGDLRLLQAALDTATLGYEIESSAAIVAVYTPPPRPPAARVAVTW